MTLLIDKLAPKLTYQINEDRDTTQQNNVRFLGIRLSQNIIKKFILSIQNVILEITCLKVS